MVFYIQRYTLNQLETIDEFTSRREAEAMQQEYERSDLSAYYYVSKRACKAWNN